jgi:hypothetical protein
MIRLSGFILPKGLWLVRFLSPVVMGAATPLQLLSVTVVWVVV